MQKHILSLAIGILSCAASASTQAQSAAQCSALIGAQLPGVNLQIATAQHHASRSLPAGRDGAATSLSAHCRVEGEFDRRQGVDGKSYALRFAINMPDAWNGRFLFQGGGGLNGALREPIGALAAGSENALNRGSQSTEQRQPVNLVRGPS
jgi:feruloyl esterase